MASASASERQCQICRDALQGDQQDIVHFAACKHDCHLSCALRHWHMGRRGCCAIKEKQRRIDLGDTEGLFRDPLALQKTQRHVSVLPSTASSEETGVLGSLRANWRGLSQAMDVTVEPDPITRLAAGTPVTSLLSQGVEVPALLQADRNSGRLMEAIQSGGYRAAQLARLGFTFAVLVRVGLTASRWKDMRAQFPVSEVVTHMKLDADVVFTTLCDSQADRLLDLALVPWDWEKLCNAQDMTAAAFFLRCGVAFDSLRSFHGPPPSSTRGNSRGDMVTSTGAYSLEAWANTLGLRAEWSKFGPSSREEAQFVFACTTFRNDAEAAAKEFESYFGHTIDLQPHIVEPAPVQQPLQPILQQQQQQVDDFGVPIGGAGQPFGPAGGNRGDFLAGGGGSSFAGAGAGLGPGGHVMDFRGPGGMGIAGQHVRSGWRNSGGGSLGGHWVPDHLRR